MSLKHVYNKMKRKESSMAAIKFPLRNNPSVDGLIDILDADGQHICTCPNFEMTQAVYLSLYCAQAAERVHTAAAAISGLGGFELEKVRS